MWPGKHNAAVLAVGVLLLLASCGNRNSTGSFGSLGGVFGGGAPQIAATEDVVIENTTADTPPASQRPGEAHPIRNALFGRLFGGGNRQNATTEGVATENAVAHPIRRGLFGGLFGGGAPQIAATEDTVIENATAGTPPAAQQVGLAQPPRRGLFGRNRIDPNSEIQINKYIWNASLDVLGFLPLQSADPFTGVIVTGFGTPPGGGRAYRATILIRDPALEARSLTVALVTRSGAASTATIRAVENAILARARQLRVGDNGL